MSSAHLKQALVAHQIARLKDTYRDFLSDETTRTLGEFFFDRIYSTRDKDKRDADFKRMYETFKDRLGDDIAEQLRKLIHVNELTDVLDDQIVEMLQAYGLDGKFTNAEYERAYRECDNYDERAEQIELLCDSMVFFHTISHWRSMALALKVIKLVARLKGAKELAEYLDEGYRAFRTVKDIHRFRDTVYEREFVRLNRIYGLPHEPRPVARKGKAGTRRTAK